MAFGDGDFNPNPIDFPDLTYTPGSETGKRWFTPYSSQAVGAAGMVGIAEFQSNFITRDIAGKTAGICVNPWDFNMVKGYSIQNGGGVVARPENYNRTSFTKCDCSYHACDKQLEGIGYTFDLETLQPVIATAFSYATGTADAAVANTQLLALGFSQDILDGVAEPFVGIISAEEYASYKSQFASLNEVILGNKESILANYVFSHLLGSVTAGVRLKNNILSILAFSPDQTITITGQDWGDVEGGSADWTAVTDDILNNYADVAEIPGLGAEFIYAAGIEEKCMCLDAGMHGLDAYPKADYEIVKDQTIPVEAAVDRTGWQGILSLGFEGTTAELGEFFTIDPEYLKAKGVIGVKPYRYGPNWAYGFGYSEQNVIAVGIPEYKNWEARNSSKIRLSGIPNGEPYSFGNQWLEWGQRIGSPEIEYVPVSPISYGGGDFVDPNFGYRGKLNGSLIYKGRLPTDVLAYERDEYTFAFKGISAGNLTSGGQYGGGINKALLTFTSIRHTDATTNEEAYGVTGTLEDILFSTYFSESQTDKNIYTQ